MKLSSKTQRALTLKLILNFLFHFKALTHYDHSFITALALVFHTFSIWINVKILYVILIF